jgi:hypothetical protein
LLGHRVINATEECGGVFVRFALTRLKAPAALAYSFGKLLLE